MKSKLYQRTSKRVLHKKLVKIFNRYIRLRDARKGCISCITGPVQNAGHYYNAGSHYAKLTFDEQNVNGQCIACNYGKEGNKQGYRDGLIRRYGEGVLELLKVKNSFRSPWMYYEYEAMIRMYTEKVSELEGKKK